jgi:citrate synthase
MITQDYLKEWFYYNPIEGTLIWKKKKPWYKIGDTLGALNGRGYLIAQLEKNRIHVHRLIWLYHYGELPKLIDHINRNSKDNRIENLRLATSSQNSHNSKKILGKHLPKGITYQKKDKLYRCFIKVEDVKYNKAFKSLEDAKKWIMYMRNKLHGDFACHG